jgi:L-asparaginase/Glu-tRNA(Gln) amidotransferase subunit D
MSHNGGKWERGAFKNPTDTAVSVSHVYSHGEGDWERLSDASSQTRLKGTVSESIGRGKIRADSSYEIELSERLA